jgi:Tol biopolymer transport system component
MHFDPVTGQLADSSDAGVDAFQFGPFGPPRLVPELAGVNEDDDPTLTDDLLEIYWEAQRSGSDRLTMASRATADATWSAPVVVMELDSVGGGEACPEISRDGLTIMFSSYRGGGPSADIYISTRQTRTSAWSVPVPVPELNSAANDYCPIVTESGLELFFHSERAGGPGARDIYRTRRATLTSPWEPPVLVSELDTPGEDESAYPLPGDLELVFASNGLAGNRDLFFVTRSAIGEPFGTPMPLTDLNTSSDDSDAWVSRDGHTLYFASSRTGDSEIYEATR